MRKTQAKTKAKAKPKTKAKVTTKITTKTRTKTALKPPIPYEMVVEVVDNQDVADGTTMLQVLSRAGTMGLAERMASIMDYAELVSGDWIVGICLDGDNRYGLVQVRIGAVRPRPDCAVTVVGN